MQKIKTLFTVFALTIGCVALSTGCATTAAQATAQRQSTAYAVLGTGVTLAATFGTQYDLQQRPGDQPYFVAAQEALGTIATSTNEVTAAAIQNALTASGNGNSAANPAIATAIGGAVNLITVFLNAQGTNSPPQAQVFKDAASWISNGILAGLPTAAPNPAAVLFPPAITK